MNKKKVGIGAGIFFGVLILVLFVYLSIVKMPEKDTVTEEDEPTTNDVFNPAADPDAEQVSFSDEREMNRQLLQGQRILEEYEEDDYTFGDPFIMVDPYDVMPLSAIIMFETEKPARIRVRVEGKDENTSIEHVYDKYETEHRIPVLGLYPDKKNTVQLDYITEDGKGTGQTEVTIKTDPLPDDFLQPELVEAHPEKMEDGLSFMIPTKKYMYAIDSNADVRWYSSLSVQLAFERLENGHILFATQDEARGQYNQLLEMDMLGKIHHAYIVEIEGYEKSNIIHHDIIELPSGNLLATTHEPNGEYIRDQMIEIDRSTGETRRFINGRDLFPSEAYEEYTGKNADENDWFHQNAIMFDNRSNSILISARSQDAILKTSYPDADIEWILAAHEEWPASYDEYLLEPIGNVKFPAGQNAMKVLPTQDGNPDTMDVLLFDNNTVITRGDKEISDTYSRAVQYRINEVDKTVEEVWSYGEDRGKDFYSAIIGDAQYLFDTGNKFITFGAIRNGDNMKSTIVEVTGDDPEVVFEVETPEFDQDESRYVYQSIRESLYPENTWDFFFEEKEE